MVCTGTTVLVKADDNGIESKVAWYVSTNHELLAQIDAMLDPQSAPSSLLVNAVRALGNDPFQAMSLHECEHVFRTLVRHLRVLIVELSISRRLESGAIIKRRMVFPALLTAIR